MLLVTETLVKYCGVYLFTVVDPTIYICVTVNVLHHVQTGNSISCEVMCIYVRGEWCLVTINSLYRCVQYNT